MVARRWAAKSEVRGCVAMLVARGCVAMLVARGLVAKLVARDWRLSCEGMVG